MSAVTKEAPTHDDRTVDLLVADDARTDGADADGADNRAGRKERVLHTRVSAVLDQELKRLATNLRMPVSNVVRAILEDAVETMDSVGRKAEGELRVAADRLAKKRDAFKVRTSWPRSPVASDEDQGIAPSATAREGVEQNPTDPGSDGRIPEVAGVGPAAERVAGASGLSPRGATMAPPLAGVIGYQPLLLAADTDCVLCGRPLHRGERAFLGITAQGAGSRRPILIGDECLPAIAREAKPASDLEKDSSPDHEDREESP